MRACAFVFLGFVVLLQACGGRPVDDGSGAGRSLSMPQVGAGDADDDVHGASATDEGTTTPLPTGWTTCNHDQCGICGLDLCQTCDPEPGPAVLGEPEVVTDEGIQSSPATVGYEQPFKVVVPFTGVSCRDLCCSGFLVNCHDYGGAGGAGGPVIQISCNPDGRSGMLEAEIQIARSYPRQTNRIDCVYRVEACGRSNGVEISVTLDADR